MMLINPQAAFYVHRGVIPPHCMLNSWYLELEPVSKRDTISMRDVPDRLFSRCFTRELSELVNRFNITVSEIAVSNLERNTSFYSALDTKRRLIDEDLHHPIKGKNINNIWLYLDVACFVDDKDRGPRKEEFQRALCLHFHFPHGKVEETCTVTVESVVASSLRNDNRRELALLFLFDEGLLIKGEDCRVPDWEFGDLRFKDLRETVSGGRLVNSKMFQWCETCCTTISSAEEAVPDNRSAAALNAGHVGLFCKSFEQLLSSNSCSSSG
jgi:hypothetical protein